jgi:hypothetical protein
MNSGLNTISDGLSTVIDLDPQHPHSPEEARIRYALAAWGHRRWPGYRCLHEVPLSERRIDMAFVGVKDIVGIEIKSSRDRLDRLEGQIEEYRRWLPEVWVAVATKWRDHDAVQFSRRNLIVVDDAARGVPDVIEHRRGRRPYRDELVCSRMLGLLWREEAARSRSAPASYPATARQGIPGTRYCLCLRDCSQATRLCGRSAPSSGSGRRSAGNPTGRLAANRLRFGTRCRPPARAPRRLRDLPALAQAQRRPAPLIYSLVAIRSWHALAWASPSTARGWHRVIFAGPILP